MHGRSASREEIPVVWGYPVWEATTGSAGERPSSRSAPPMPAVQEGRAPRGTTRATRSSSPRLGGPSRPDGLVGLQLMCSFPRTGRWFGGPTGLQGEVGSSLASGDQPIRLAGGSRP
jgi:hypothetical protein